MVIEIYLHSILFVLLLVLFDLSSITIKTTFSINIDHISIFFQLPYIIYIVNLLSNHRILLYFILFNHQSNILDHLFIIITDLIEHSIHLFINFGDLIILVDLLFYAWL